MLKKAKVSFLRYTGCLNFIKDHIKHGLFQIQALLTILNFQNCSLLVLLPSESMLFNIATRSVKDEVRICFGPLKSGIMKF